MPDSFYFTKFMRPETYAESRGFSIHTVRYWIRNRIIPSMKIGRVIALDPAKADNALARFERKSTSLK
jgi:hypothetical protein